MSSRSSLSSLQSVADAARSFVRGVSASRPQRVEAQVSSREGMPLLCAVEAAFAELLPREAAQELVWLSPSPPAGVHRLRLAAYGPGHELLAEAVHEFGETLTPA